MDQWVSNAALRIASRWGVPFEGIYNIIAAECNRPLMSAYDDSELLQAVAQRDGMIAELQSRLLDYESTKAKLSRLEQWVEQQRNKHS